jgi:putative transposase
LYYEPIPQSAANLMVMRLIDEQYLSTPFYGSRRMAFWLKHQMGLDVNRKRVQRLMRLMGLEPIYARPQTSVANPQHKVYPYLLRDLVIDRVDLVWSTDITYVPMAKGFLYLTAVIDWYSRFVLAWRLSNSMDVTFCLEALEEALTYGTPKIFNTDQGSVYTSLEFTGRLLDAGVAVSMNGKGRCLDNVFCERLWRSVNTDKTIHPYLHTRCRVSYNRPHTHLSVGPARTGELVPRSTGC